MKFCICKINSIEFEICIFGSLLYLYNVSMEFIMNFIFILRLYGIFLDIILYEFCRLNISNGDIYIVLIVDMGVMLFERYFIRVSL